MIKLDVQVYCQDCPFFEVKVKKNTCDCVATDGEHIFGYESDWENGRKNMKRRRML